MKSGFATARRFSLGQPLLSSLTSCVNEGRSKLPSWRNNVNECWRRVLLDRWLFFLQMVFYHIFFISSFLKMQILIDIEI